MELTVLDWVAVGIVAFSALVGTIRGFSGELGSLVALAAAVAAGYFLFPAASALAVGTGFVADGTLAARAAAFAGDALFALVAYALARRVVAKAVSWLLPQPFNALAGLAVGLVRGLLFLAVPLAIGFVETGSCAMGTCADSSPLLKLLGTFADMYVSVLHD